MCALSILSTLNLKLMTNRSQREGYCDSPAAPATPLRERSILMRIKGEEPEGLESIPCALIHGLMFKKK